MNSAFSFIFTKSSYGQSIIQEGLDMAMLTASMEQKVYMIFIGAGVQLLKNKQNGNKLGYKDYLPKIKAAKLYGVEKVYACAKAIETRNLTIQTEQNEIEIINSNTIKSIIEQSNHVVTF